MTRFISRVENQHPAITLSKASIISTTIVNFRDTKKLAGLYVITDTSIANPEKTITDVEQALAGGARIIQFRDKSRDQSQRLSTAKAIRKSTHAIDALFIVNDDVELAKKVQADGVHLGKDDTHPADARKQLGENCLIGVSCYNRFDLAVTAVSQGADYVAFGSFFPSSTKPNAVKADVDLLHRARQELDIPVAAIGGITLKNGFSLVEAGADMLAVVQGVFGQTDIKAAAEQFCFLFSHPMVNKS